jgi:hypothetical protein
VNIAEGSKVRAALVAGNQLLNLMVEQPSHITEIVPPHLPHYYGYVDFAACGMGGVLLPCTEWVYPLVWRVKIPPDIEAEVRKRNGSISNSDGEAAAVFVQELSLESWVGDTRGISTHIGSDNSPTVGWNNRMASRAVHNAPEVLLRWQALRQRYTRRGPTDVEHIAGVTNRLGDFPSRSFEEGFPADDDAAFLLEFSRRYPLPSQLKFWKLAHPPTAVISAAFSVLRNRPNQKICPGTAIGESGVALPLKLANTLSSYKSRDPPTAWNAANCSWPLLGPSGEVSSTKATHLQQRRSRLPYNNAPGSWTIEDLQTLADSITTKNN